MPRYRSNVECDGCHEHLIWDSDTKTLTCGCRQVRCGFVNLRDFHLLSVDALQQTLEVRA